uniref:Uncharacterized protein n=1 Tax=Nelumbo nucifera TaxID=4432 RepID=A0A822XL99_NELNU|nr:TPA_asm: hypothetical protein HUJ06_022613 [Nelumbo nucifera]
MAETIEGKSLQEAEKKKEQSLPFYQLFSFADKYDWVLMIAGSIRAVVHGSAMPVFFLLFGDMKMTKEVAKYALYFVYLGLVVCLSSYATNCLYFDKTSLFKRKLSFILYKNYPYNT